MRILVALLSLYPTVSSIAAPITTVTSSSVYLQLDKMTVSIEPVDQGLVVELGVPSAGWAAVGFNAPKSGLTGSRLIMVHVVDGVAIAEEHWSNSPHHGSGANSNMVRVLSFSHSSSYSRYRLFIPDRSTDSRHSGVPILAAGVYVHLIAAWSVDRDFDHHSRFRASREVQL